MQVFFHRGNPAEPDARARARNEYLTIWKSEPYYARRIFRESENEKSFRPGHAFGRRIADRGHVNPFFSGYMLGLWSKVLEEWTEVIQPMPNH